MTLLERVEAWRRSGRPRPTGSQSRSACTAVDRWQRLIAGGDALAFDARLRWDGFERRDVVDALSWVEERPTDAAAAASASGWSDQLEKAFDDGASGLGVDTGRRLKRLAAESAVPFIELWAPWLAGVDARVHEHRSCVAGRVASGAVDLLLGHLLRQIGDLASEAAYQQFARRRAVELPTSSGRAGREFYMSWVALQTSERLAPLLDEYPFLGRQLHRLLSTWVDTSLELLDRIERDRPALEGLLGCVAGLGPVVEIQPGLSDRHDGGRRVAVIAFESGQRVVYKPRSLTVEAAFSDLLSWAVSEGLEPEPSIPQILSRDGYGWMEHIDPPIFEIRDEVSRWFTAAGSLLCLAHVLGASDLHFDNVRVGASSPVLIDLETLLRPATAGEAAAPAASTAAARVAGWMRSSFDSTGMLSFLMHGPEGAVIDIGGLCGAGGHELSAPSVHWSDLGCDSLRRETRPARARQRCNLPILEGKAASVVDYLGELQDGFSRTYRFIVERRGTAFDPDKVAQRFRRASSRVVLRPSEQYARVLRLLLSPACQRDGVAAGLAMEALYRGLIEAGPRPASWGVVEAERRDLTDLDVPRFTAAVDATIVRGSGAPSIAGLIELSGLGAYEQRLRRLSEEDLARQLQLMALSIGSLHGAGHLALDIEPGQAEVDPDGVAPATPALLLGEARAIADELAETAVAGDDGSLIWLDPIHLRPHGRRDFGVSYYLYSGSSGVGLFFAAAARAFPGRGYERLCASALLPVVAVAGSSDLPALVAAEGIGACHGLGGLVYVLALASDWLDEPSYLSAARRLALEITADRIAADQALDVEGGAAGAILGLLALHHRAPDERVLDTARACGRRLLEARRPGPRGGAAWPSRQGGVLPGLAHGASGGALALVRLWRATGDGALLAAAEEAFEFENSCFDPRLGNWPVEVRDSAGEVRERRSMVGWCHGAPGIALARAELRRELAAADAGGLLDAAVETTLAAPVAGPAHLCCGSFGRVDVMHTVGNLLERDDLRRAARSRASVLIRSAAGRGAAGSGVRLEPLRPGLFRGLAGIGYVMLRLAMPDAIPSVLAFETMSMAGARR